MGDVLQFTITRYWVCPHGAPHVEETTMQHAPGDERSYAVARSVLELAGAAHVTPNAWLMVRQGDPKPADGIFVTREEFLQRGGSENVSVGGIGVR